MRIIKLAGIAFLFTWFVTCTTLFSQDGLQKLQYGFTPPAGKPIRFTVHYNSGYKAWAEYVAQKTENLIKATADYLDFPFPINTSFVVRGKKEVWFKPTSTSKQSVRIGGVHNSDGVEIEYRLAPIGKPALLFHELSHYWFGYYFPYGDQELNWLMEGIVSFLPFAMHQAGKLPLTAKETGLLLQHWGMYNNWDAKHDYPLAQDRRFEGQDALRNFFYIKSFHIQYLIYLELGNELYCQFLKELLKTPADYRNNQDLLMLLNRLKKQDWAKALTGWVFPGKYLIYQPSDFTDYDTDGLPGIAERLLETSPVLADTDGDLLPDGFEQLQGLNPLIADSSDTVQKLIQSHGLWADGLFTDWEPLGYQRITATVTGNKSAFQFTEIRLTANKEQLFVALDTSKPLPRNQRLTVELLIDLNNDRQAEQEYVFELNRPDCPWIYFPERCESERFTSLCTGLGTEGCEFAIPFTLPGQKQFAILPIIYGMTDKSPYEKWQHWIPVDVTVLTKVAESGLKTNLEDDDADQDGIPDLAEFRYQLDPFNAEGKQEIIKYGPFIDGNGTEWKVLPAVWLSDADKQVPNSPYDIQGLFYSFKKETLYIFMPFTKLTSWTGAINNLTCDLIVDLDGDEQADREFVFLLTAPQTPWVYIRAAKKSSTPVTLKTALKEGAEFAIPLSLIGTKNFRLFPIIRDMKKKINYEEFPAWLDISLK